MKVGDLIRIKPKFVSQGTNTGWQKKQGIILEIEDPYAIVYWDEDAPCLVEYVHYLEKIPLTKVKNRLYYRSKESE